MNEENKVDIIGQEESLISPYYAGTYDLLVNINGDPYLVDSERLIMLDINTLCK